jgi:hypothetical protein
MPIHENAPAGVQAGEGQDFPRPNGLSADQSSTGRPRRHQTDEEWVAWLTGPLPVADRVAIEDQVRDDLERTDAAIEAAARTAMARDDALGRHVVSLAMRGAAQIARGESHAELSDKRGELERAERARWHQRRINADLLRHHPHGRTA